MFGAARQSVTRELVIHTPDGRVRPVALESEKIGLGRSSANELCYGDDAGLSRQHLVFERSGDGWLIRDLGSKNGTLLNGARITSPQTLRPGDRITAGHLTIEYREVGGAPAGGLASANTVVFVENPEAGSTSGTTVATSLAGILAGGPDKAKAAAIDPDRYMRALVRAGRELSEHQPLDELFKIIMDLSIDTVGATRGVLMTLEGEELVVVTLWEEGEDAQVPRRFTDALRQDDHRVS